MELNSLFRFLVDGKFCAENFIRGATEEKNRFRFTLDVYKYCLLFIFKRGGIYEVRVIVALEVVATL